MKSSFGFVLSLLLLLNPAAPHGHSPQARISRPQTFHAHEAVCPSETLSPAAITWSPVEVECPVCQTKNIFLEVMSYGNYIYGYPSKYQMVFWPYTDGAAWYSCKKCRLTAFMGDFAGIPQDKIPAVREALKDVKLPPQKERPAEPTWENATYRELPVAARLVAAEKVYRALGQTGDEFWDHFYRVLGYHFDAEEKKAEADETRRKSLAIVARALADKGKEGVRKELLYISGAMKHYLRDDAGALGDFEAAKKLTYFDQNAKPENNTGFDGYLSKLIDEYIEMLRKGEGPRTKKTGGGH
jgi:hypothetical protein